MRSSAKSEPNFCCCGAISRRSSSIFFFPYQGHEKERSEVMPTRSSCNHRTLTSSRLLPPFPSPPSCAAEYKDEKGVSRFPSPRVLFVSNSFFLSLPLSLETSHHRRQAIACSALVFCVRVVRFLPSPFPFLFFLSRHLGDPPFSECTCDLLKCCRRSMAFVALLYPSFFFFPPSSNGARKESYEAVEQEEQMASASLRPSSKILFPPLLSFSFPFPLSF